jgi:hypothetical protein
MIPITCAVCIATPSRADTPPAEAPPAAPVAAAPVTPPPARSRVPEIAATIVTGGLVIATAASYREWNQAQDRRRAAQWDPTITVEEHTRAIEDIERWKKRTWLLIGGTFVSGAVTMFTWMRNQDPSSFSVQPTGDGDGAAVSYSGRF